MSRDATIVLPFPDGEEYNFRLAWGQLIKLQESRNAGPFVIYQRLFDQTWLVEDIGEVIRLGLIGGGMAPTQVKKLMVEYIEADAPIINLALAQRVMSAGLLGPDDEEDIEKKVGAASGLTISTTDASASPPSMEPVH